LIKTQKQSCSSFNQENQESRVHKCRINAIKLRFLTSPFEKGGLRGILSFNDLNPPYPPFSKGGIPNLMALRDRLRIFEGKNDYLGLTFCRRASRILKVRWMRFLQSLERGNCRRGRRVHTVSVVVIKTFVYTLK